MHGVLFTYLFFSIPFVTHSHVHSSSFIVLIILANSTETYLVSDEQHQSDTMAYDELDGDGMKMGRGACESG